MAVVHFSGHGALLDDALYLLPYEVDARDRATLMTELTHYLTAGGPRLVHQVRPNWQQTPGVELRFERTIFAAGP